MFNDRKGALKDIMEDARRIYASKESFEVEYQNSLPPCARRGGKFDFLGIPKRLGHARKLVA